MSKRETRLAIFYNFRDPITCPFCKLIYRIFDFGGRKMVRDRLAVVLDNNFKHDFLTCFLHHYWLLEEYNDQRKPRAFDIIVREGFQIFNGLKKILSIL